MKPAYHLVRRERDGKPRLVMSMEPPRATWAALPVLILAVLPYDPKPNGLPANGDLSRVTKLEERLIGALKAEGAVHLGHITFDGSMTVAFHAPNPVPAHVDVRSGFLRSQTIRLESRPDPEWDWYDREMRLSREEWAESRNRKLLQVLAEKGDDASKVRSVDFSAFFPTAEQRDEFVRQMEAIGYGIGSQGLWQAEAAPRDFWCELVAETSIEPSAIAARCAYLDEQAERNGGVFDEWATPVVP